MQFRSEGWRPALLCPHVVERKPWSPFLFYQIWIYLILGPHWHDLISAYPHSEVPAPTGDSGFTL